jgi:amino acid efflux transporter
MTAATPAYGLVVTSGTAMLLGGLLGPGAQALPALAAQAAGPASVVAWGCCSRPAPRSH